MPRYHVVQRRVLCLALGLTRLLVACARGRLNPRRGERQTGRDLHGLCLLLLALSGKRRALPGGVQAAAQLDPGRERLAFKVCQRRGVRVDFWRGGAL